jgi:single-strand DNA-binding protein|tara:strand:- start:15812 stop:16327 length:516 start_codon:yes stop_codon:yes gene_type:complete
VINYKQEGLISNNKTMDLNKVMLIGNITQDPEVRTTPSGISVTSFGLATNLVWNDQSGNKQEKVEFHNIVAWRRLAEIMGQYLHKGSKIYIEGRLQTSSWDDQSGNKKYRTEVIADNMIMLDRKGDFGGGGGQSAQSQPQSNEPSYSPAPQPASGNSQTTEEEIKVEDIPF